MKLISAVFFVATLVGLTVSVKIFDRCTEEEEKDVDTCIMKLVGIGFNKEKLPETLDGMGKVCGEAKEHSRCIRDFSDKCLDLLEKQITGIIVKTVRKANRRICKSSNVNKYIEISKCLNDVQEKMNAHSTGATQLMMNLISDNRTLEEKLPISCCLFFDFKDKIFEIIKESKEPRCTPTVIDDLEKEMKALIMNTVNDFCDEKIFASNLKPDERKAGISPKEIFCSKNDLFLSKYEGDLPETMFLPFIKFLGDI